MAFGDAQMAGPGSMWADCGHAPSPDAAGEENIHTEVQA